MKLYASKAELARALGISPQAITKAWDEQIPRVRQFEIQELTGGKLKVSPRKKRRSKR